MVRVENPVTSMVAEGGPLKPGIVENGSNPSTHPLRRGAWLRPFTDPTLRGVEEGAMATGRVEILETTNLK